MTIPDYQSLMLPVLDLASDGEERRVQDAIKALSAKLKLTEAEQSEMLPSGKQTVFSNRVHWAKTYLVQAQLLEIPRRSYFKITKRGREALSHKPEKINVKYLKQFDEFREFQSRTRGASTADQLEDADQDVSAKVTPDELLRETIARIENVLAKELLNRILSSPPAFFENLIVTLLLRMGYGGSRQEAGRALGGSGDGGIDGVIDQDVLGLDRVYLQAKRYNIGSPVSEPDIRGFSGSLGAAKANKGIFVTTSYFTKPAIEFAEKHPFKMVLIDGDQLTSLMIRHGVGVRIEETLELKKIDEDFFNDE